MLGVYKISQKTWQTLPVFIHSTKEDQRMFYSTFSRYWIFQKNLKTVFTWPKGENFFNDESWSKPLNQEFQPQPNGLVAPINFPSLKVTFHIIPY